MQTRKRSMEQLIEEQVKKWQMNRTAPEAAEDRVSIITISREPGSGGRIVAEALGQKMGLEVCHQEMIHAMAESADISRQIVETLDGRGLSILEDWVFSLVNERHLWPDRYLKHLMKVVGAMGEHGKAVLVGRGANFILPPSKRLSIRITAPRAVRESHVAREFNLKPEEAHRRVMRTEANRKAFVRKYFYSDIADPHNYDLLINTQNLNLDTAVATIQAAFDNYRQ